MSKARDEIEAGGFSADDSERAFAFEQRVGLKRWAQPGPQAEPERMARAAAALHDVGGLPGPASLAMTQLVLNIVGRVGRKRALALIDAFIDSADGPP